MKYLIASDIYLTVLEGEIYAKNQYLSILKRYYKNFGRFIVCCRIAEDVQLSKDFAEITDYVDQYIPISASKKGLLKVQLHLYDKVLSDAISKCDLVVARCPGTISSRAVFFARKHNKPYHAEVVGCPWDSLWNYNFFGKLIAPSAYFGLKRILKNADYAQYVTSQFLQKRYPCPRESLSASNVYIKEIDDALLDARLEKINRMNYNYLTLVTTAAVDVRYKGQEYVIKAIPALNKMGIKVHYMLIGGGSQEHLKKTANSYGVSDQVEFLGRLPHESVFDVLDKADIYLQPSLQEGLPRSVIEAMSRGCPCIGARTAGIPELIAPECVVKRKSVLEIYQAVCKISNPDKMAELAKQNFENAKNYLDAVVSEKRNNYYQRVLKEIDRHGKQLP